MSKILQVKAPADAELSNIEGSLAFTVHDIKLWTRVHFKIQHCNKEVF